MAKKEKTAVKKGKNPAVDLSIDGIKNFIEFTKGFKVYSLSLKEKDKKITVYNNLYTASQAEDPVPAVEAKEGEALSDETVKSRFVGSFHLAKGVEPEAQVKKGAVLAKIYSMKIEHQIKAEKDCTIQKVLIVENGPVDYGKPLFIIK